MDGHICFHRGLILLELDIIKSNQNQNHATIINSQMSIKPVKQRVDFSRSGSKHT